MNFWQNYNNFCFSNSNNSNNSNNWKKNAVSEFFNVTRLVSFNQRMQKGMTELQHTAIFFLLEDHLYINESGFCQSLTFFVILTPSWH